MKRYTITELEEALRAIHSTIGKCEKVQPKMKEGTSQHTLLVRRIKAFQIASALIKRELENQSNAPVNHDSAIYEYQRLLQTTELQKGYQEFVKFFRQLRTYLQNEIPHFTFTGNIVENNMDYSYFQFTDADLKAEGLKIVVVFVHADFEYQIWLSGLNREIQTKHQQCMKAVFPLEQIFYPYLPVLTDNPAKTDYIVKAKLVDDVDYSRLDDVLGYMKDNTMAFVAEVARLLTLAKQSQL